MSVFATPNAPAQNFIAKSNRLAAAARFVHEYPAFERQRLLDKIKQLRAHTNEQLETMTCDGDGVRITKAYVSTCKLLKMAVDDRKFFHGLAVTALGLYQTLQTPQVLEMIEQYVELLKEDY